jgi:ribosomal protein L7/L12
MSYFDPTLPEELRAAFGAAAAAVPPLELDAVCAVIEGALDATAAHDLLRILRSTPIAAGPLGQVHRSTLSDGTAVAVKVQRPDVAAELARDLEPATVATRLAAWFRGGAPLGTLAEELAAAVRAEADFTLTAQHQDRFWWLYASHPIIVVPTVQRTHSSARVLTTDFMTGVRLDKHLLSKPSQEARDRAGAALFDFYIGTMFEQRVYSCDPHPDNHVFLPDGRIAVVDFGSVRELLPLHAGRITGLTHALWSEQPELIQRALVALGVANADEPLDEDFTMALLRAAYGPMLRDEVTTFDPRPAVTLNDVIGRWRRADATPPSAELYFLLRLALGLGALLGQLGARANWRARLQALLKAHPQPSFDVVLVKPGKNAITTARELRDATGLPLREVEYLMNKSPQTIKQSVPREEAEALRERLEKAGAQVEIKLVSVQ